MKTKLITLVLASCWLAASCASTPDIYVNSDPSVNVATYSTFGFFTPLGTDKKGYGSLTSERLKAATRTRLESLGYKYSETNSQLLINFAGQLNDKLRVDSAPVTGGYYGYRAGMYGAWGGYNTTYVDQYTEGTLNIDIVDAAANRMVWEGVATGRVTDETMQNIGPAIDSAVAELLANFPAHAAE
jgi:hypothetical protein